MEKRETTPSENASLPFSLFVSSRSRCEEDDPRLPSGSGEPSSSHVPTPEAPEPQTLQKPQEADVDVPGPSERWVVDPMSLDVFKGDDGKDPFAEEKEKLVAGREARLLELQEMERNRPPRTSESTTESSSKQLRVGHRMTPHEKSEKRADLDGWIQMANPAYKEGEELEVIRHVRFSRSMKRPRESPTKRERCSWRRSDEHDRWKLAHQRNREEKKEREEGKASDVASAWRKRVSR